MADPALTLPELIRGRRLKDIRLPSAKEMDADLDDRADRSLNPLTRLSGKIERTVKRTKRAPVRSRRR